MLYAYSTELPDPTVALQTGVLFRDIESSRRSALDAHMLCKDETAMGPLQISIYFATTDCYAPMILLRLTTLR